MFLAARYSHIFREGRCDSPSTRVSKPRYRNQFAADSVVLDHARKEFGEVAFVEILFQINCVRGADTLPNNIYHIDVDVSAFRRPVLLILLQRCRSVLGPADEVDLVSRLLGPLFGYGS